MVLLITNVLNIFSKRSKDYIIRKLGIIFLRILKIIFDILENPEKMKEKFRIIFTDPVNFGKGYHDTTDDCYRRIIDFLDEHKKIETTITIKVQDKVSGKFLYLVLNKS
jgi:hypothetical protein